MMYVAVLPTSAPEHVAQRRDTIDLYFAAIQAGDAAVLYEVLTPDAITSWPQSGERITGAMSRSLVYANYPGARIARITDYFGPTFPAPEWRQEWVEREAD